MYVSTALTLGPLDHGDEVDGFREISGGIKKAYCVYFFSLPDYMTIIGEVVLK